MKLMIHDLREDDLNLVLKDMAGEDVGIVSAREGTHHCIGCFGCWIKTPDSCVIRDGLGDLGELFAKCDELIIISECFYGGYSPEVKKVLDRSISYQHPYFVNRNGEMHHKRRYQNHFNLRVLYYGGSITPGEKKTTQKLAQANAVNLDCALKSLDFMQDISELQGAIL